MKKSLVNNFSLKLISVFVAFVIWLFVVQDNDPIKTHSFQKVQVETLNKDSVTAIGKVFEVVDKTNVVTLYVTGRVSVLGKLSSSDFKVEADLEELNEMKTVPIKVTCLNTSIRKEDIKSEPASLKISIEDKVEQEFPIKAITQGIPANGYEVGNTQVRQGDSIIIAGPQSLLNIIDKVNVPVDVTQLEESTTKTGIIKVTSKNGEEFTETQMENLEFKTSSGVLLNNSEVNVYIDIWEVQPDIKLDINVTGEPAIGYMYTKLTINPGTISLAGTQSALDKLDGKLLLDDEISIEGATAAVTKKVELGDTLAGLQNLKIEDSAATTITITAEIEKVGNKTVSFPITRMTIKNAPSDLKMTLTPTDKLPITIAARTENLNSLNEDDIMATLDLKEYKSTGTYPVPVNVELPDGYELAQPVTIVVNLDKKEETVKTESE